MPNRTGPTLLGSLCLAALLGAAGGALVGALEALGIALGDGVRYTRWAARIPPVAAAAYAALGAGLALPCAVLARLLGGRPNHRAAPDWVAAGLGTTLALAAFALVRSLPNPALLPAAVAGTLLFGSLRELLAWWPAPTRIATWTAAAGLALAACVGAAHTHDHAGPGSLIALVLAALGALGALHALASGLRTGRSATLSAVAALALPLVGLGLQAGSGHPTASGNGARAADAHSILHVSIDTLRPERLGCYGNGSARTPTIDRLAAEGVLFEHAVAQSNTTGPSHTTQLTGLYPAEHGALSNMRPISSDVPTVVDLLGERYDAAAFVSGFTLADGACGLAPRFDYYDDNHLAWQWLPQAAEQVEVLNRIVFRLALRAGTHVTRSDRPAGWTTDAALDWLASRESEAPFYLFLHFYDPHVPYEPPAEFAPAGVDPDTYKWYRMGSGRREELVADSAQRATMLALYDGEIAYADAQLGRVIEALERSGELERTIVVMTSDHGEGLGAHDYYYDHGTYLYDEELRVPLLLRLPGARHAGTRVAGQTRLLDLTPTLLELSGVTPEERLSGDSLVPLFTSPSASDRPTFARAEMAGDVSNVSLLGRRLALRSDRFKLIWTSTHWLDTRRIPERFELYDLAADPDELRDLYGTRAAEAAPLVDQLRQWNQATEALVTTGSIGEELLEHMRALGYL